MTTSSSCRLLFHRVQDQHTTCSPAQESLIEPSVYSVKGLGNVQSCTTFVKRDLGFQGRIGPYVLLTYGDTLFSDVEDSDQWRGMTCNSVAFASANPIIVFDPLVIGQEYPQCFLKPSAKFGEDRSTHSLGLTNVVETTPGQGNVFFLLNHRPHGSNHLLGAGVATIYLDRSNDPPFLRAIRPCRYMWNAEKEPWFGDVCALRVEHWIYAYGHMKDNPWVYLARCPVHSATDVDSYAYWDGEGWTKERLEGDSWDEKQSVFWQVNQGQVFWSNHFRCYMFIYCDNFWSCQVLARTSPAPQGPWSQAYTIHRPKPVQENGNIYAAVPHPYYDTTGKTLVITYTNHPNTVQAIRVTFDKENICR